MRVTGELLVQTFINDIRRNIDRLNTMQHQISNAKKIFKPSDDPVSIDRVMTVRQGYDQDTQYEKNVDDAQSVVNSTDTALGDMSTLLLRLRDLAVRGANEIDPQSAYDAMAVEVNELIKEAWAISNTKFQGRYIFGGTQTRSTAFTMERDVNGFVTRVVYQGDRGINEVWSGIGISVPFNIAGGTTVNVSQQMDGSEVNFFLPTGTIPSDRVPPVGIDDIKIYSSRALFSSGDGSVAAANPTEFVDTVNNPFTAADEGGWLVIQNGQFAGQYKILTCTDAGHITVAGANFTSDTPNITYEIKPGIIAVDIANNYVTFNRAPGDIAQGDTLIIDPDPDPPEEPSIFGSLGTDMDNPNPTITGSTDLFQALIDLRENLTNYNVDGVFNSIANIDRVRSNVLNFRTALGVRYNRMTLAKNRIEDTRNNLKELQSKLEDLDMAEAITQLKTSEDVYRAALAVGARVIQPTLLDFLR